MRRTTTSTGPISRWLVPLRALAGLVLTTGAWQPPAAEAGVAVEPDIRRDAVVEAVQQAMPAVVNIATEEVVEVRDPLEGLFRQFFDPYYRGRPSTQRSLGSGVIIDEEGFVLTNFHVVNRARRIWVRLADGREFECDRISGTSATDVALLKIRARPEDRFTAVRLAADDDLLLGETVLALGNPFGLGGSVSRGILSSKSRRPPKENEALDVLDWLQTDAAINPGNSGGPLLNLRGELIGLNVAILSDAQGIGFAVPVKRVASAIAEIYSPEVLAGVWFGARVRPGARPWVVASVQPDSPAARGGLREGDQILQLNGKPPRSFIDFIGQLTTSKDTRGVSLLVQRGGERRTVTVRMVQEATVFNADLIRKKTGLNLQELTADLAQTMGLRGVEGLLIGGVDRQSPAAAAELQSGMVVTSVDGQPDTRVVAVAKLLHAKAKGEKVRLAVAYPRQRGPFLEIRQAAVELTLR
jgi:S1-C subfamily serine protease